MAILRNYIEGNLTRLNKLKYGDTATIGTEPIVQKTIPTDIRQQGPSSNQVSRRIDDLKRIGTILTQKPGLKYLANETALNAAKVEFKTKKREDGSTNIIGTAFNAIGANLFNSVKIIGSTLLQVPLNGTGTHFVKGFAGIGKGTYLSQLPGPAPHVLVRNGAVVYSETGATLENEIHPKDREISSLPLEPNKKIIPQNYNTSAVGSPGYKSRLTQTTGIQESAAETKNRNLIRKEGRIGVSDTSFKRTPDQLIKYWTGSDINSVDKINNKGILDITQFEPAIKADFGRDLIKFRFNIITPDDEKILFFRAYLDSFNDNYSGNWNSFNYVGRGESFYTYQQFDRSISLSFKIAANTSHEMRPLYQKIVALASATAPTYSETGYMRGTLTKLTVGDYVDKQIGILNSVNYSWDTNYPWEIAMNHPEATASESTSVADKDSQELPMVLNCTVNFTPIHDFVPQTGLYHYITSPYTNLFFGKEKDTFGGKEVEGVVKILTEAPVEEPVKI